MARLNSTISFLVMVNLFLILWAIHLGTLRNFGKTPLILNPSQSPYLTSIFASFKYFFKLLAPTGLLITVYILDRTRLFQKFDYIIHICYCLMLICALTAITVFAIANAKMFMDTFYIGIDVSLMPKYVFEIWFAQTIYIILALASYIIFKSHFSTYQSIYLSILTILTCELAWEFAIELNNTGFHWAITDVTLYLARYIPVYYLLIYAKLHILKVDWTMTTTLAIGVISSAILFAFHPFQQEIYFRALWAIPLLAYAHNIKTS